MKKILLVLVLIVGAVWLGVAGEPEEDFRDLCDILRRKGAL